MADGRLKAEALITRSGIFKYRDEKTGKERLELREDGEVFSPAALASFSQVPVTNNHPPVGLLSAKNAKTYMVGSTGDVVVRDGDHVRTNVMVADAHTIAEMEAGKRDVSCGYECDIDETPGVHPVYGRYDARQLNVRGNHLAIVHGGRAGSARVRMDGVDVYCVDQQPLASTREGLEERWSTRLDAARRPGEAMPDEKMQETIRSLSAQLDELKKEHVSQKIRLDEAESRADREIGRALQLETTIGDLKSQIAVQATAVDTESTLRERVRADEAERKVARFDATLETRVRSRARLERQAFAVLGPDFRMDDMNDRDIMATVVRRLDSTADVSPGVTEGIIAGRFLTLIDGHARNAQSQAKIAEIMDINRKETEVRTDAATTTKTVRDQWKKPLPNDIRAARKDA